MVGWGVPVPAARMDRTSAARQRPNATARASASSKACSPCAAARVFSSASSGPSRVFPAAAAPVMNASAVGPSAQNAFSCRGSSGAPPAAAPAADRRSDHRGSTPRPARPAGARRPPRPRRPSTGPAMIASVRSCSTCSRTWAPISRDRHRVARRPEPDTGEPVDLAGHRPADAGPQRRQRGQQLPLDEQPLGRHRADLRVHRGVDLDTPPRGRGVRRREVGERVTGPAGAGDHQVGLGVADQVLHDPLRLRVRGLAEVGPEPVVRGEAHVLARWAPPCSRPPRPSGSPSGRRAPPPGPRPGSRSTPRAAPASSRRARCRRSARTAPATTRAPRRTRAARPAPPSR